MKTLLLSSIILLIVTNLACLWAWKGNDIKAHLNASNNEANKVLVWNKDQPIYEQNIFHLLAKEHSTSQLKQWKEEGLPKDILEISSKQIALDNQLLKKAIESGLSEQESVVEDIKQAKQNIIRDAYLEQLVNQLVTEKEVIARYSELKIAVESQYQYALSHILLKSEKEALIIYKALRKKKKSFEALANTFSLDNKTNDNGGQIGYLNESDIPRPFASFVQSSENMAYSSPIQTQMGWHIIRVNNKKQRTMPPLPNVQQEIEQNLKEEAYKSIIQNELKDIQLSSEPTKTKEN